MDKETALELASIKPDAVVGGWALTTTEVGTAVAWVVTGCLCVIVLGSETRMQRFDLTEAELAGVWSDAEESVHP